VEHIGACRYRTPRYHSKWADTPTAVADTRHGPVPKLSEAAGGRIGQRLAQRAVVALNTYALHIASPRYRLDVGPDDDGCRLPERHVGTQTVTALPGVGLVNVATSARWSIRTRTRYRMRLDPLNRTKERPTTPD